MHPDQEGNGKGWVATAPSPEPFGWADRPRTDRFPAKPTSQVVGQVSCRRVATTRLLRHGLKRDRLQVAWNVVVQLARWLRVVMQDLVQKHPGRSAKRQLAGQQQIEDYAQAVDITATVHGVALAPRLLGRHVSRRAQHLAFEGHGDLIRVPLRQAEIHHVGASLPVKHHVRWLDITMDHSQAVRIVECVRHLGCQSRGLAKRELAAGEPLGQVHSDDEIADDEWDTLLFADLVHGHDRRVAELGGTPRLAEKACAILLVAEVSGARDFHGHRAIELRIAGLVNRPNAPVPTVSISSKRPSELRPSTPVQVLVASASNRNIEPHEGQRISSGVIRTISMGFWQCGQRMCMTRPSFGVPCYRKPVMGGVRDLERVAPGR